MTPLMTPTPCLETEESPEPPPLTRFRTSQSHRPCPLPPLARPSSLACTHTLAAHCIARMSKSAPASLVCRGSRRGAGGARMEVGGAQGVRARKRVTVSRPTPMAGTAISGCSMTSVSLMLSRRAMAKSSAETTRPEEEVTRSVGSTQSTRVPRRAVELGIHHYNQYNHLPHEAFFVTFMLPLQLILQPTHVRPASVIP